MPPSRPTPPAPAPDPAPPDAVRASRLTVHRGHRTVLDDLAFTVPTGRVTGLLGPSGCGKSTLMRAVVGTQRAVTGELTVLGAPAGTPALRPRVGYVTQAPSVYDDLSVRQNLAYFAAVLDPGRRAARRRTAAVDAALEAVDLTRHSEARAGALSGGQRSRVSLAVALLGSPELLVLDEPIRVTPLTCDDAKTTDKAARFHPAASLSVRLERGLVRRSPHRPCTRTTTGSEERRKNSRPRS
ncbi:ATP-binding cassette domain-containing protein [Streptomyces sp. NEAU-H3]|uniref:ATP-binding cassette domain-containing protein n=1 Tax=Streptomyces sp. NEAU-H3 TaxID=2720636 RepID=UPI001FD7AE85|nr:ABC transporter ATP-binding protein [Streptomyces sp. NEAU-H3]